MLAKYNINLWKKVVSVLPNLKYYKETVKKLVLDKFGIDNFKAQEKRLKINFEKKCCHNIPLNLPNISF